MRRPMGVAGAGVALVWLVLTGCTGWSGAGPGGVASTGPGGAGPAGQGASAPSGPGQRTGASAPGGASGSPAFRNEGEYGAPPRIPSAPGLPGGAHALGFARDGSGFALLAECVGVAEDPESGFCRQHVAVRDAGVERWVPRRSPLPRIHGTDGVSADLLVLGPGRALITDGGGDRPEEAWFTRDGGRSWRAVDRRTVGRVPEIPAGAVLTTDCADPAGAGPDACARKRLVVVSPADGRRRALVREPLLGAHPWPAAQPEPDGSWWVSGVDPLSGRAAVAVSRDAGRSWTVSRLPSTATTPGRGVAVVVGRDAVYAAELGELPGGEPVKNPLRALHRSLDGGRSWQRTWTTGPEAEPRTLLGVPVPGPGGRVEIGGERDGYGSVDGGRRFTLLDTGTSFVRRTPLGLLRESSRCVYELTADGVRWSEFELACEDRVG
ncbi:exo-alpha-sialidase [Streptomyces sp. NPDC057101]|uniref:exo-alpha-sialidase n=1 Tax=Streptomyces sp. NPDC057101 TaxID=3346020 RepID=UPI0036338E88